MKQAEIFENTPARWLKDFPWPGPEDNKYSRGHAIICGGGMVSTGAAKLAATCALRSGAGLVSVACDEASLPVYAASFEAVMTKRAGTVQEFSALIEDPRVTAVLVGPGGGVTERTRAFTLLALAEEKRTVIDADALTVFAGSNHALFSAIHSPCILTPHGGEFERLFGAHVAASDCAAVRAQKAAKLSGAVVLLKGFHSIIAAPDGRTALNNNATPFLATAGSGDALAGICTGLLAQGMDAFYAACAAAWLHGEASKRLGAGLIASDIQEVLPGLLQTLYEKRT